MSVVQVRGVMRNGRVELSEPLELPDGAVVMVSGEAAFADDAPATPDEIAATLQALDAIESLEWTDEEVAVWEAERQERKEREKAAFATRSESLRGVWE